MEHRRAADTGEGWKAEAGQAGRSAAAKLKAETPTRGFATDQTSIRHTAARHARLQHRYCNPGRKPLQPTSHLAPSPSRNPPKPVQHPRWRRRVQRQKQQQRGPGAGDLQRGERGQAGRGTKEGGRETADANMEIGTWDREIGGGGGKEGAEGRRRGKGSRTDSRKAVGRGGCLAEMGSGAEAPAGAEGREEETGGGSGSGRMCTEGG